MHYFSVQFLEKIKNELPEKILDSKTYIIVVEFDCEKLRFH